MPILPSHKQGLYYLEHCRVLVKDEQLHYLNEKDHQWFRYFPLPYGNMNALLLGTGTSITQAATRLLAEENVMLGFCGGGGTPLFLGTLSEYRPTRYFQKWISFWFDEQRRLQVARYFQNRRTQFVRKTWSGFPRLSERMEEVEEIIAVYQRNYMAAGTNEQLMGFEANFAKSLYGIAATSFGNRQFVRQPGKKDFGDLFNSYLDRGNYLAYGLGATALWVLGLSFSMPVSHGETRRGGLVFDVADIIKDATILPNAFLAAREDRTDQEMRDACTGFLHKTKALEYMLETLKYIIDKVKT